MTKKNSSDSRLLQKPPATGLLYIIQWSGLRRLLSLLVINFICDYLRQGIPVRLGITAFSCFFCFL